MTKEWVAKALMLAAMVFVGGKYILPFLVQLTFDLATIALLGTGLMILFFLLPAIAEAAATLGFGVWESIINAYPINRLKRDLAAHSREVANLEAKIAEANAACIGGERVLNENRRILPQYKITEREEELRLLKEMGVQLISLKNKAIEEHEAFESEILAAEADYKIGTAFKEAGKAFAFAKRSGPKSMGANIALDAIKSRLDTSRSTIQMALSRPMQKELSIPLTPPKRIAAKEGV